MYIPYTIANTQRMSLINKNDTIGDALENDTKADFQENIPGKVQFQKKLKAMAPGHPPLLKDLFSVTMVGYTDLRKKSRTILQR